MTHNITIPGLDREYCSACRKWVCRDIEIQSIEKELQKEIQRPYRRSQKKITSLQLLLNLEKKLQDNCG